MAQQIQFIYLTQSDYDGLTPQTSKIYFTSDTHRIYKGSDLYAATTFDQLNFSTISASGIFVDGSAVSLEGHSHSMSDISGLDAAISAATSNFATWGHQHVIADVTNLPGIVSGITTTGITKSDGNFTNLNATSVQASAMNVTGVGTFSSVSASTATFGNLVVTGDVSMTLSQVTFGSIMASDIQVDGTSVALVGHTHVMSEITDLDTTAFASSNHTHPELSGLTSSTITKDTGTFTNLDATSITASGVEVNGGIQASTVSASSATFQSLTVTGEVTMSLSSVDFQNINASSLTVNGSAVSLEGHSHSASEISGLDAVISAATSSFATSGHTHNISDITSLATKVSGLTSSKVEKTNGVFTNLSTTNLVVSSAEIEAISIEASSMTVNGTGTFNAVSASTATFGDINVTGTASLSTTNVTASTLTAGAGSFTTLTVGGSNVALEGHGHSIADIEDYEDNTFWITGSANVQTLEIQVD